MLTRNLLVNEKITAWYQKKVWPSTPPFVLAVSFIPSVNFMFHSIWWKLPQFDFWYCSVLTRILPWGVPGPPLLRNRGSVRTLGGQRYNLSLNNLSPHSKWSVSWSTYLIQYGGRGVYDSITMHAQIFVMYVGPMKWDQS